MGSTWTLRPNPKFFRIGTSACGCFAPFSTSSGRFAALGDIDPLPGSKAIPRRAVARPGWAGKAADSRADLVRHGTGAAEGAWCEASTVAECHVSDVRDLCDDLGSNRRERCGADTGSKVDIASGGGRSSERLQVRPGQTVYAYLGSRVSLFQLACS